LSLLGYSLLPQSNFDPIHLNEAINQIGQLLSKNTNVDQLNDEQDKYTRASLDDFELGRLLGYGCNVAVYEARLRTTFPMTIPSNLIINDENNSESDIEILSRQSSNCSSLYEDAYDHLDDEERLNELTLKEVRYRASANMIQSSNIEPDILPAGQFNLAIKMLFNYVIQ
jgi:PHD/YefM family antitoxin component YafN of YafNO toxin-antitoxin module